MVGYSVMRTNTEKLSSMKRTLFVLYAIFFVNYRVFQTCRSAFFLKNCLIFSQVLLFW